MVHSWLAGWRSLSFAEKHQVALAIIGGVASAMLGLATVVVSWTQVSAEVREQGRVELQEANRLASAEASQAIMWFGLSDVGSAR